MKRAKTKTGEEFKLHWKNYIFQSAFAMGVTFIVLLCLKLQDAVIIASIGSTAFIVFALPKNITARSRNVIGGYLVGFTSGALCSLIPQPQFIYSVLIYSLAVGTSILTMVLTNTEHPPASGIALGVAIRGVSPEVTIAVVTSAIILSSVRHVFKKQLRDLT